MLHNKSVNVIAIATFHGIDTIRENFFWLFNTARTIKTMKGSWQNEVIATTVLSSLLMCSLQSAKPISPINGLKPTFLELVMAYPWVRYLMLSKPSILIVERHQLCYRKFTHSNNISTLLCWLKKCVWHLTALPGKFNSPPEIWFLVTSL